MAEEKDKKTSQMMQHYRLTKKDYPNAILFYRLGDFYEMFDDDAVLVSKLLELTLTARAAGGGTKAAMCGVPYHAAENYIAKLLKLGHKVAICEQVSEAQKGKQVDREVVRVITPGTVTSDIILEENKNNFILCVARQKKSLGVAYADITTGEFFAEEYTEEVTSLLNDIVTKLEPAEIICNLDTKQIIEDLPINKIASVPKPYLYLEKSFIYENAVDSLTTQFGMGVLTVFELNDSPAATVASGALIDYLLDTQKIALKQIVKIKKLNLSKYMILDSVARRNLEITETIRGKKTNATLLGVIDHTKTAMGARLLRQWFEQPLKDEIEINLRLDGVEELYKNLFLRENLNLLLKSLHDIERISSKIGMKTIMPKECISLKESLSLLPNIKKILAQSQSQILQNVSRGIENLEPLKNLIESVLKDDPATHLKDGGYIREGFNEQLDYLRNLNLNITNQMHKLEEEERVRIGVQALKVGYNRVYGYYFEIPKDLASCVPIEYHRKATVGNFDRYFSEELKKMEEQVLTADEDSKRLEQELYSLLREKMLEFIVELQTTSKAIATLDCLISLAVIASKNNYVRPIINNRINKIAITDGRHPVVENMLKDNQFIPNSTLLNQTTDKLLVITGPNMAGKSTYMRQVAIISLMAHIGSFVPASSAEIAITDRIFTRVGASDDLASGQSTFMVEMMEMANILNNATDSSLIILDEIGRGTSTFDGLSIAWAILEFFAKRKAKVLFATHYHELAELEGSVEGVKNYQISVKEVNNSIIFLRKIIRGGANRSFGIEVASLAGIPNEVIARAKSISHSIAQQDFNLHLASTSKAVDITENDACFKHLKEIEEILKDININKISPLEAFEILQDLIKKI